MTESEAIEVLKQPCLCDYDLSHTVETCDISYCDKREATHMAITALSEIQQYRAIGTVSEFRQLKEKATAKKPTDVRYFGEAGYYIGLCPTCKSGNNSEYEYCGDCGQKLQWFERSEGKE